MSLNVIGSGRRKLDRVRCISHPSLSNAWQDVLTYAQIHLNMEGNTAAPGAQFVGRRTGYPMVVGSDPTRRRISLHFISFLTFQNSYFHATERGTTLLPVSDLFRYTRIRTHTHTFSFYFSLFIYCVWYTGCSEFKSGM